MGQSAVAHRFGNLRKIEAAPHRQATNGQKGGGEDEAAPVPIHLCVSNQILLSNSTKSSLS